MWNGAISDIQTVAWLYPSIVPDLFNCESVGWSTGPTMTADIWPDALTMP